MAVRVRFAPSPTGLLHVGALRTALFDFLLARHQGGQNILRIEDTDRSRYSEDSEHEFIESLRWAGITFDEGPHVGGPHVPYRQSERATSGVYVGPVSKLLESGDAYKAFDTTDELAAMRKAQEDAKEPVGYFGGAWRDADPSEVARAEAAGHKYVVRQRIPRGKVIAIDDPIRGHVEWSSDTLDDPVLLKADGMPTYHLAAIVDDHLMGITHVIRGEEWLPSAAKHVLLYRMLGWEIPVIAHCPVILGKDGKKLSKRHGATSVLEYRWEGYLASALNNFIVLIGWSPGDERELLTEQEMIDAFSLEGVQPSPGHFDLDKLKWMSGAHIRLLAADALFDAVKSYLEDPRTIEFWDSREAEPGKPSGHEIAASLTLLRDAIAKDPEYARGVVVLLRERVQTLADFGPGARFFFVDMPEMDPKAVEKWLTQPHVPQLFDSIVQGLDPIAQPTKEDCEALIRGYAEKHGLEKLGPAVHPVRVALTGTTAGPGLFELMELLGRSRIVARLRRAKEIAG